MRLVDPSPFPAGLKAGDFIQTMSHCGGVFFEVKSVITPEKEGDYWMAVYWSYDKYASRPRTHFVNNAGGIRAVIPAEMADPVMQAKRLRYHAGHGQFDPFYGFAPLGTPLRMREAA